MMTDISKIYMEAGLTGILICLCVSGLIWFVKNNVEKSKKDSHSKDAALKEKHKQELQARDDEILKLNRKIDKQKAQIEAVNNLMQNNFEVLVSANMDAISNLIKTSFEDIENKHTQERQLLGDQSKNIQIQNILNDLLVKVDADRVSIFEYHNGGVNMKGTNFQKLSCTNQVVKHNIHPTQTNYQNMFQSSLQFVVNELQKNGECFIPNTEDIRSTYYHTYKQLSYTGNKSGYYMCLKDNDIIIGFLSVCYINSYKSFESSEIRDILKNYTTQLEKLI